MEITPEQIAAALEEAAVPVSPQPPTLRFEVAHGGIDGKKGPAAERSFAEEIKTAAIGAWFPIRSQWPPTTLIGRAEVQIVGYDTKSCGTKTAAFLGQELGKWLYAGGAAAEVQEPRVQRDGKGRRIHVIVKALEVRPLPEDGATKAVREAYETLGQTRQLDGYMNVGNPCNHRDAEVCRIRRCAWLESQRPPDPDPLEEKAHQIDRVVGDGEPSPEEIENEEHRAVVIARMMRGDHEVKGGNSENHRRKKKPPKTSTEFGEVLASGF